MLKALIRRVSPTRGVGILILTIGIAGYKLSNSVKQILSPLRIGAADHPHDMAAGVKAESAWLAQQLHIRDL